MPQPPISQTHNKVKQRREAGSLNYKKKKKTPKFDLRKGWKVQPEDGTDIPCKETHNGL